MKKHWDYVIEGDPVDKINEQRRVIAELRLKLDRADNEIAVLKNTLADWREDSERIDWIVKNGVKIDAPAQDNGLNWSVARAAYPFGGPVAYGPDLRKAIDLAARRVERAQED